MYFIPQNIFGKRLMVFLLICAMYVAAVLVFHAYTNIAPYYKAYYLKSYGFALDYSLRDAAVLVSNVLNTRSQSDAATAASSLANDTAGSVPVLLYHGILNTTDGSNVTLDTFMDQMSTLKNAGYQTVSLDDFYAFLRGEKKPPAKSFLLTFDDGRKDTYYPADPILRALHYNAVIFAIEKFSELDKNSYYLSKEELSNMEASGRWDIESHTRTHRNLETVPPDELTDEISGSKQGLEALFGKPIIAFAFPFGEFGQEPSSDSQRSIMELARKSYEMSFFQFFTPKRFTQNYPDPTETNNYLVKRISVLPIWSGKDLLSILESGAAKPLPFTSALNVSDGWINTLWGDVNFDNGRLAVRARPDGTGSVAILDGSRAWSDYQFDAHVFWQGGSNIYLWARYQDDENYLACNFSNGLVHVEQTLHGKTDVIKGVNVTGGDLLKSSGFTASIRVQGRTAQCLYNGSVAAQSDFVDPSLDHGGIGIKVWDHTVGTSAIEIAQASVAPLSSPAGSSTPAITGP